MFSLSVFDRNFIGHCTDRESPSAGRSRSTQSFALAWLMTSRTGALVLLLLPFVTSYGLSPHKFRGSGRAAVLARSAPTVLQFGDLKWPWDAKQAGSDDDSTKFVRHSELNPGGAPLGVVCAGFSEDDLEMIAATVEEVYVDAEGAATQHVPIVVLGRGDLRLKLRDVLAQLQARDSELPDQQASLRAPLILLSGFSTVATSATVRALRSIGLRGGSDGSRRPMFAVVVPNALDKPLTVLIDELEGDHMANQEKE